MNVYDDERLRSLIERGFDEGDDDARSALAEEILAIDPGNAVGMFLKWEQLSEEDSIREIGMLEEAYKKLREEAGALPADSEEAERYSAILTAMLTGLTTAASVSNKNEEALGFAREMMAYDMEGTLLTRVLYYSLLIENEKFAEAIHSADEDTIETPIGAYARAIALLETQGPEQDAPDALLQAISLDPDLPFFALGLWDIEGEEDGEGYGEDEEDEFDDLMMQIYKVTGMWSVSESRLAFLASLVFAFGYLTDRIDDEEEIALLEKGFESIGCMENMTSAKAAVMAIADEGEDFNRADEEALMLLRGMMEEGLFSK